MPTTLWASSSIRGVDHPSVARPLLSEVGVGPHRSCGVHSKGLATSDEDKGLATMIPLSTVRYVEVGV